jgi:rubrerythrin
MQLRPSNRHYARARPTVECAQCFERIYAAEWSEYLDDCHVRHLWACDVCGYRFETLVKFPAYEPERPAA